MVTEVIRIHIPDGESERFLTTFRSASKAYYAQPGCVANRLFTVEDDATLIVGIIEWADKNAFESALSSPVGQAFISQVGPLMAAPPDMVFCRPA